MSVLEKDLVVGKKFRIIGNKGVANKGGHRFTIGEEVTIGRKFAHNLHIHGELICNTLDGSDWWWVFLDDLAELESPPLSSHEILSDFKDDITVAKDLGNKYKVEIPAFCNQSDVYDVLVAFNVTCPAAAHAIKKLLCAGLRGHKNTKEDKQEAINSIRRSLELDEHRK